MGCSQCNSFESNENAAVRDLMKYCQKDDYKKVEKLLMFLAKQEKEKDLTNLVNRDFIPYEKGFINLLGYVILVGDIKVYSLLVFRLNGSLQVAEQLLNKIGFVLINIICKRGALELFKLYLPVYLSNAKNEQHDKACTLSFNNSNTNLENPLSPTAIQTACMEGHLCILHFIEEHFSINLPPPSLDVHYIDEVKGENCALVACRTGNLSLMKYLFETLHADFHIKNYNNEGALQILAAATKSNVSLRFLECVMYLVDVVKIDIKYMYEETLLLLECKIIVQFIENKLKQVGVFVMKSELETQCRINVVKYPERLQEKSITGDTQELSLIAPNSYNSLFSSFSQFQKP